nr:hypothetical protein [Tanacetum cinerariifolium]
MSSFNQRGCFGCGGPLDGLLCRRCTCEWCGNNLSDGFCSFFNSRDRNSFIYDSNPNFFDNLPNFSYNPPQPQYDTYTCELCGNESDELIKSSVENLVPIPSESEDFFDIENDEEGYTIIITPVLPTKEPDNFLSMGDEHLSTISETESDELIKSSVENLVPIPSESEDFFDIESECDVPVCDDFTTSSNPLFDYDDDFSSSDDESFSDEDVSKEIYSNPLFDEEIISTKIEPQFFGELAHIDLIPPGINEADFDPEEEICLVEKLLYDNSSPRPPEEVNSKMLML